MPLINKITTALFGAGLIMVSGVALATEPGEVKIVDDGIPVALTNMVGDAAAGKKTLINRKKGNCLACHAVAELANQPFHGEVGPALNGIADRYSEAQLRLLVVNAKMVNEDTIMPAFYRTDGLTRVAKKFDGKTILSAQQVEDVLAYIKTLKE